MGITAPVPCLDYCSCGGAAVLDGRQHLQPEGSTRQDATQAKLVLYGSITASSFPPRAGRRRPSASPRSSRTIRSRATEGDRLPRFSQWTGSRAVLGLCDSLRGPADPWSRLAGEIARGDRICRAAALDAKAGARTSTTTSSSWITRTATCRRMCPGRAGERQAARRRHPSLMPRVRARVVDEKLLRSPQPVAGFLLGVRHGRDGVAACQEPDERAECAPASGGYIQIRPQVWGTWPTTS